MIKYHTEYAKHGHDYETLIVRNKKDRHWHHTEKTLALTLGTMHHLLGCRIFKQVVLVGFDENFLGERLFMQFILPAIMGEDVCKLYLRG